MDVAVGQQLGPGADRSQHDQVAPRAGGIQHGAGLFGSLVHPVQREFSAGEIVVLDIDGDGGAFGHGGFLIH